MAKVKSDKRQHNIHLARMRQEEQYQREFNFQPKLITKEKRGSMSNLHHATMDCDYSTDHNMV